MLEHHAPALLHAPALGRREIVDILAEHLDQPGALADQADQGARQHGFSRARGADDAQNLAAIEVEVEAVEHELLAEADLQPADADHGLAIGRG